MTEKPTSEAPADRQAIKSTMRLTSDQSNGINIDWDRESRTGIPEAVLAESKSNAALLDILAQAIERAHPLLFTRISEQQAKSLSEAVATEIASQLDYHALSNTLLWQLKHSEHWTSSDMQQAFTQTLGLPDFGD